MQHEERTVHPGIKWLVAVQLIVGVAPLASLVGLNSAWLLPIWWALSALSIAQLTLLSFWVGMSERGWLTRLALAAIATAYVSYWPVMAQCISSIGTDHDLTQGLLFIEPFLFMFANYAAFVALISAGFVVMRRRGMTLASGSQGIAPATSRRSQYSVFHLLVMMSLCSLVLSLLKVSHPDEELARAGTVALVASYILVFIIFLINSVCAAWATLNPSAPWVRIAITISISWVLGIAFAIASGYGSFSWWIFLAASLIPVVSTTLVVLSLLVVRACGYRVVQKTTSPA
jgi:hypothetical protein